MASCHCPARPGEDCPKSAEECRERVKTMEWVDAEHARMTGRLLPETPYYIETTPEWMRDYRGYTEEELALAVARLAAIADEMDRPDHMAAVREIARGSWP